MESVKAVIIYIVISVLIALADLFVAWRAFPHERRTGRYMGLAFMFGALVDISYLVSILSEDYFAFSLLNSVYFSSIDVMLLFLLVSMADYTNLKRTKLTRAVMILLIVYGAAEIVSMLANPWTGHVIGYIPRSTIISKYSYSMKFPYIMHLGYSYLLVALSLAMLIKRMIEVPWSYKRPYLFIMIGILLVILVNAVFLYLPGVSVWNLLDYSICGYSIVAFLIYWCCFEYTTNVMPYRFKSYVFEAIDRGIVLFDFEDKMILSNASAQRLLRGAIFKTGLGYRSFLEDIGSEGLLQEMDNPVSKQAETNTHSFIFYVRRADKTVPIRCDRSEGFDRCGRRAWRLMVFSKVQLDYDLLTGFISWQSFLASTERRADIPGKYVIGVCDINGLGTINRTEGQIAGDRRIGELAGRIRNAMPETTTFIRGRDAILIVISTDSDASTVSSAFEAVRADFDISFQYAVNEQNDRGGPVLAEIEETIRTMRNKKMLDSDSSHAGTLTSLIRALKVCDADTERHVRQTQDFGARLGRRIGLSETQLSDLSLLCMLHDIGKITIPLEILNKPGKLTGDEMAIMRTHSEKGYEIAMSAPETTAIAEMILHHHERWDGKGYPDGLKEKEIPLLSRIISVVDAYDAMIENRVYRPALGTREAMNELIRCAGTQFDPELVGEFIAALKEGKNEQEERSAESGATNTGIASEKKNGQTHSGRLRSVAYSRYTVDDENKIFWVDDSFESITGYGQEDIRKGLSQFDLLPEEDRDEYVETVFGAISESGVAYLEHPLRRKDGSVVMVMCSGRRFFDPVNKVGRSDIMITRSEDVLRLPS